MKLSISRLKRIENSDPLLPKLVFRDRDFSSFSIRDLANAISKNTVVTEIVLENICLMADAEKWSAVWRSYS